MLKKSTSRDASPQRRTRRSALVGAAICALLVGISGIAVAAAPITLDASLDTQLLPANVAHKSYLRIALRGGDVDTTRDRAPMNVAIVLDKSSSMAGAKIARAKDAALAALDELRPNDIVSVVAYDNTVRVLVPATKASDRAVIERGINQLSAGGSTALFGGTSKGAAEVRKFFEAGRVNRVVLLSDGRANIGPSSPGELARLGRSLRREGISVTTVGLGLDYNEDLMVSLASTSGGQHAFVEHPRQLTTLFKKGFGSLASIVAKEAVVTITLKDGFRPVRALSEGVEIQGNRVSLQIAQLYSAATEEFVVELQSKDLTGKSAAVADIAVSFHNVGTGAADTLAATVSAGLTEDMAAVTGSANRKVKVLVAEQLATQRNEQAMALRDNGRIAEARQLLKDNARYLDEQGNLWKAPGLMKDGVDNDADASNLEGEAWNQRRKKMKHRNFKKTYRGGLF